MAGVALSILLLWWTLHDVQLRDVLDNARRANRAWLILSVALATLTFPIRAWRWQLMLRGPAGERLPFAPLWHAVAVGFMANNLLPARAGEFARAYMAGHQGAGPRFTTALASIGVERVFDGLTIVGLLACGILSPSFPRDAVIQGVPVGRLVLTFGLAFAAALVVALAVVLRPLFWLGLAGRTLRVVLPERFAARVVGVLEGLVGGLAVLRSPQRFAGVLAWSVVLWLVNAASFLACFYAFGIAVPTEAALVLQGFIAFGVAVPSTPGFVGVFEAIARVTLAFYGVASDVAVSYALTYHITTFIPITLLGLWSLSRARVRLSELRA